MKHSAKDKDEAKRQFDNLKQGDTIYTILRSVSRSGMQRIVSVVRISPEGFATHPNWSTSVMTGLPLRRTGWRDGIIVRGCGFDAAQSVVGDLSYALFGDHSALRHEAL